MYRLFYMYPSGITPAMVELIAGEARIVPYLDIDGVTNLRGGTEIEPGALIEVEIVDALDYDLIAEVVEVAGAAETAEVAHVGGLGELEQRRERDAG